MGKKVLVLGIGNILLKDDGLGPIVVQELQESFSHPDITFLDGGTLGLDLLAYLEGYDYLIIIDALDMGQKAGSIFYWQGKNLKGLNRQISSHQVGIKELLHAANLIGINLEVLIMGMQIGDISWGIGLSPEVQESVPLLKETVVNRLQEFLKCETLLEH